MSYNGSGTFQINTSGQPVVTGTVISSSAFNALTADLATGLSTAITKDGQTTTTARISFAQGINSSLATDTTSGSSGSIYTAGGVGITKGLFVGGTATFSATPVFSALTASSAVATDASKNLVSVTNTGTGNNVLATSPTLVTPALGTPSALVGTNITGTATSFNINGTVGATTPSTGSFTSLAYSTTLTGGTGIVNLGSGQFYKDASGNVGIGSTAPSVKLHVVGAIGNLNNSQTVPTPDNGALPVQVISNNYSNGSGETNLWNTAATLTSGVRLMQVTGSGTYNDMAWFQKNTALFYTGNTERMRIDSSGNVGIGTSSPSATLHVVGSELLTSSSAETKFTIDNTGTGGVQYWIGSTNNSSGAVGGGKLAFYDQTSNAVRMVIDSSGNVGIGTSSPSAVLGVNGDIKFGSNSSGTYPGGRFYTNSGTVFIEQLNTQSMQFKTNSAEFIWNQGANERMRIDSSGNVGIGTSSPSASAILDAQSTTKGVRMPNMTTTQKNAISSPAAGLMVFDTTLAKLCVYSGSAWQTITSI